MKKNLKKEVLEFYDKNKDIKLVCQQFKSLVYPDTLKRWCFPELNEIAKQKAKNYHNKNKHKLEYKEKRKLSSKQYRTTEEYKVSWKEHYNKTKEKRKRLVQEHRLKNLEHYKELAKKYYQQNKEQRRKQGKIYYNNNKDKLHGIELQRYHTDPVTNLKHSLRISLNRAIQYGATKNNKALKYLGCDIKAFKKYIEKKFKPGMSWLNRTDWHIDHIIPLVKINDGYTLVQLCHYTNLQPLWKHENLQKSKNVNLILKYTAKQLQDEIAFYKTTEGNYGIIPSKNKIVLNYQPHFYDYERVLWQDTAIQEKLINNRCKYLNKTVDELTTAEILRGFKISGIHYSYSHFSPLWFKKFITDFNIKSVYDPCGGWGHRLLGTLGTSLKDYIYNDYDLKTVNGVTDIVSFIKPECNILVYNNRAELFIPNKEVDAIFTCPPYYNKEIYNNKIFKDKNDFIYWWEQVTKNCLQTKCKYFGVVIDNNNQKIISKPLNQHKLIIEQKLNKNKTHLSKQTNSYETLLVYQIH
jgi:hypothetical protein